MTAVANPAPAVTPRWRRILASLLIVLSCVMAPLSIAAVWVRNEVLNTNRYVENVTPLASNPAIIDAAATNIVNALFENIDVKSEAEHALPPRADFLAAPLAAAVKTAANDVAVRVLESDRFKTVWVNANRRAHAQVQKALTGGGTVVQTKNGKVTLDLSSIVLKVKAKLHQRGITIFDSIPINKAALKFQLFDAKGLAQAQSGVKLLNSLSYALPILMFVFLGLGLWLSSHRRRTLLHWGIGIAIAIALLGAGLNIGRGVYLDAVSSPSLPRNAAAAAFDTLVRFMRTGIRIGIVIGIVVAIGAWLVGPGKAAQRLRGADREGTGPFGEWVGSHRNALRIGGVGVAILALTFWSHPTGVSLLVVLLLLLIYLGVVELIVRNVDPESSPLSADS